MNVVLTLPIELPEQWEWLQFVLDRIVPTVLILAGWWLAVRFGQAALQRSLEQPALLTKTADLRRRKTIVSLLRSTLRYTIGSIAVVSILSLYEVPVTPLLAGAGIVGLAIGFGAQNLVRDVITGFLLILEDYYAVDDYVTIGSTSGRVIAVGLRTTQLEDFSGAIHHIPNGQINQVTNSSRRNQRFLVEVRVPYGQDLEQVQQILERVNEEVRRDVPEVHEGPVVLGVTQLGPSEVTLTIWGKAQPLSQWSVERQLRARIAAAFREAGIAAPFTRHVIFTQPGAGKASSLPDALDLTTAQRQQTNEQATTAEGETAGGKAT